MRASKLGALLIISAIVLCATMQDTQADAPVDIARALGNAVHPAANTTAVSDTVFANGYDNAGGQCLGVSDCPDTGSQCTGATCTDGICGAGNTPANTACSSGGYCTGGSCVCDGAGTCTNTCDTPGLQCANAPDICHSPGTCNGQFCQIYPLANGTICGFGQYCEDGVCQ